MTLPLSWSHRVTEIPDAGLHKAWSASEAERAGLVAELDLIACEEAKADYVIQALGDGRYRMTGNVVAHLTQKCVVSLEPVRARIEERFEVEFWPPESIPDANDTEIEVLSAPEIEPLHQAAIDAGRVVFETLSASLDPYPRKEGAKFDWEDAEEASGSDAAGPFAALKDLKKEH